MIVPVLIAALLQTATPAARIVTTQGTVEISRSNGTTTARTGDPVSAGDRLQTLKSSAATLSTESGATLELGADSQFEMKNAGAEPIGFLAEGTVSVKGAGKPARVETKYGQIIGVEDLHEFAVRYRGDVIEVLVIRGSVRAEVFDSSKVFFKDAADLATRTYQVGRITPNVPRVSNAPIVVVPRVITPLPRGVKPPPPPPPPTPPR